MNCTQPGCSGQIVDGYCDVCGMAPPRAAAAAPAAVAPATAATPAAAGPPGPPPPPPPWPSESQVGPSVATTAQYSGRRRAGTTRSGTTGRSRLGAGLVEIEPVPSRDPATAVLTDPRVPESRRFCGNCDEPVGRSRDGVPGRPSGFCRKCGAPFSFAPQLTAGDLVAGQYEVIGCLAHGGMGWVYLAKDRNVSDRWVVLKGLLNAGDSDATAAALAERRFLAEVEHPNIVKIFNFVQHESSGYIVMEYVGGHSLKQILAGRREANGGEPNPLPVSHAIAYMLEILPALGYLHDQGLLFCDFKLDNVIQTRHSLKLIDLGGVYRIDEPNSAVFGTVGYQAPEIAVAGPSIASDLFTVARTLAVLSIDFRGYQNAFRFTLPDQTGVPLFTRYDSLYRLLLKATAPDPDDRFQSAEQMADQLYGVLREIVAEQEGRPVPAASAQFTPPLRGRLDAPDGGILPRPKVSSDDPSAGYLATIATLDDEQTIAQLRVAPDQTVEVRLQLAAALIGVGDVDGAESTLTAIAADDPWEWRVSWYRGLAELARGRPAAAVSHFWTVYCSVPGELAPKLALAVAHEASGDPAQAAGWYEVVSRTDPSITTASFGLARCRLAEGNRPAALQAYALIPDSSSDFLEAQTARIECLAANPTLDSLLAAGSILDGLPIEGEKRERMTADLLATALAFADHRQSFGDGHETLLGCRLAERDLRLGLERSYRALARRATSRSERIELVDRANRTRPRTWT